MILDKRLSLRFPELFDNGRLCRNIQSCQCSYSIYIGGYVEGMVQMVKKLVYRWYGKPDSDFIMDAQAGIAKQEKLVD